MEGHGVRDGRLGAGEGDTASVVDGTHPQDNSWM